MAAERHPVQRELLRLLLGVFVCVALLLVAYLLLNARVETLQRTQERFHAPALRLAGELSSTLASIVPPPGVAASFVERLDSEATFVAGVTRDVGRALALMEALIALHADRDATTAFASARQRIERAHQELGALVQQYRRDPAGLARAAAVQPLYATIVAQQLLRLHASAGAALQQRQQDAQRLFHAAFATLFALLAAGLALQVRRSLRGIDAILGQERASLQALAASQAALDQAQALARLGNWEIDLRDGRWWWSAEMYRLCDADPARCEASAAAFLGLVHPEDRAAVAAALEAPSAEGLAGLSGYRLQTGAGRIKHIAARARLDLGADGRPQRVIGTAQDISEQVLAEQRVRASQARLEAVLAAVPDLWFVIDADGRHAEVSDPQHPALDRPWSELRGRPFALVPAPRELQPLRETLQRARASGAVQSIEYAVAPSAEGSRAYEARIAPMPDGQWLGLCRDISERRRAEEALARSRDELERLVADRTRQLTVARDAAEQANRAKSEFLSRMSHELRTPMNAVLGFAQLLGLEAGLPARSREFLDHITRAGKHLLHLINDVLDLAHVESGRMTLSPEPLALDDIVQEAVALMRPLAAQHQLRIEAVPLAGSVVRGDRLRVKQVLLNLLSNAVKYNRPGGWVRIDAAAGERGMLRVTVADSGQGITPEGLGQLFQPFARLGAEYGAIEGTGIGLSICKRLVEMMGGRIGAHSEVGVGSRFWIDLPIDRLAPSPSAPVAALADPDPLRYRRPACLLYVEDNPANLALVQHIVARHPGLRLISAPSGMLGFDLARSHRPDLILLDIHLPDISGYQLLDKLRGHEATRTIPVIAVTANAMPGEALKAREAGFDDYLTKPIDVPRFDATLQRLL
jgi:PAS domain S-box-containing protein